MKNSYVLFLCLCLAASFSFAQHQHHAHTDTTKIENKEEHGEMHMSSFFSSNLPMSRDGSGTSWQPDANPMFMYMKMYHAEHGMTTLMAHGSAFVRYNAQRADNNRGDEQFDVPNMFMVGLSHRHANDVLSLLTMFSLDPFTVGEHGYPLLFQSGETYKGLPLVDRQHPHDFFSELALNYTHAFSKDADVNGYFGFPGEPALGPVAFMHRLSAMNNPDAPLGHHWQDATHITFGVGTLGLRYKIIKVEGSVFTGREPDEGRYDFDKGRFDSYSFRVNINPDKNFAVQFSQGFIKSPEAPEPDIDITRTTASLIHTKDLSNEKFVSSSVVWGMNTSGDESLASVLLESNLKLRPLAVYARYEFVQKDAHELQLNTNGHSVFNISALTLGLNKVLFTYYKTNVSAGVQGTINFPGEQLKLLYGDMPYGFEVYLKLAPARM
jgi:hypothetical protein